MADPAKPSARKAKPKSSPKPAASPATDNGSPSGHTFTRSAVIDSDWAKSPEPTPPVHVAIPNTTAEKMQAIVMLCSAVQRLAAALDSVNCPILVKDCSVFGSQGHGMHFGVTQETPETKFARQVADYIASGGKRS